MTMNVRIDDKEALEALSWESLKAYLDRADEWKYAEDIPGKAAVYQHTDESGRLREILVPLRRDFGDYVSRMADAVSTLARVEDRSELDVCDDLSTSAAETAQKVQKKIRKWLTEDGWAIEDLPVPSDSFNVVAVRHNGLAINIFQPGDALDHVALSLRWTHDRIRQLIGDPSDSQLHDLVWNIYRDVSLMGLDIFDAKGSSTDMIFRTHAYFDGLTKDTLMQRIQLVNRAYALAMRMSVRAQEAPGRPAGHALSPEDVRRIMRPVAEAAGPITVAS